MEIVAVATHDERFYNSFIDSCNKYNYNPTILGMGMKYTGHLMKDDLLIKHLESIKERRVILFVDAFDCLIVRNPDDLHKEFINSEKELIISYENNEDSKIFNYFQKTYFNTIDNALLNTGMIISYSDILLEKLNIIKKYRKPNVKSNQLIWTKALLDNEDLKKSIYIDTLEYFFKNYNSASNEKFIFKDDMLYIENKKTYPFVIQGNGNTNLNEVCEKLNICESKVIINNNIKYIIRSSRVYVTKNFLYKLKINIINDFYIYKFILLLIFIITLYVRKFFHK